MTHNPTENDLLQEIHDLVTAHLQHQMTVAQRERLEELVCNNPLARRLYVYYIFDCFDLHARAIASAPDLDALTDCDVSDPHFSRPATPIIPRVAMTESGWMKSCAQFVSRPAVLVALMLFLGGLAIWRLTHAPPQGPLVTPSVAQTQRAANTAAPAAAKIVRTVKATWLPGTPPEASRGDLAAGQRLALRSGLVEIAYASGARVTIEGPATFEIESNNAGRLHVGKLVANVPPAAVGFVIDTPSTKVVDLGTQFAVAVDQGGSADVHVFQGLVTARPVVAGEPSRAAAPMPEPTPLELRAGQSAQFAAAVLSVGRRTGQSGAVITVGNADAEQFALLMDAQQDVEAAAPAASPADAEALGRWQQQSAALAKDPDAVVYYTFQDVKPTDTFVVNRAASGPEPQAKILGAEAATGRWAGKGAMLFDGRSGRLSLVVPGEYRTLSMMAWVYLQRPQTYGSSMLSGDGLMRFGMIKWDLTGQEAINFATKYPSHGTVNYVTPPGTIKIAGRWAHLAVVYDGGQGQVSQYLDGEPLGAAKIVSDLPLAPGTISLGGWQSSEGGKFTGQFEGRIDELVILKRVLSSEEIKKAFTEAQPAAIALK